MRRHFSDRAARIALATVEGVSRSRFEALVGKFGDADSALAANVTQLLTIPRMSPAVAERIIRRRADLDEVASHWEALSQAGATARFADEPAYPQALRKTADAPPMLLTQGAEQFPEKAVAIVGTRRPTARGLEAARFAATLALEYGWAVVSGLARGIDAEAHRAALNATANADVATVAVLAGDLLSIYPPEHESLAEQVARRGIVATERFGGPLKRWNFVHRNRMISGLSKGVLVVESGETDGSLHTVRFAQRQRRDIAVWDWSDAPEGSQGTRELERRGVRAYNTASLAAWFARLDGEEDFPAPWLLFEPGYWRRLEVALD